MLRSVRKRLAFTADFRKILVKYTCCRNLSFTYGSGSGIEFIVICQSRHEKDLVLCFRRIWSDV